MCGIAGFVDYNFSKASDISDDMIKMLQHRGPDGQASRLFDIDLAHIKLSHSRLSIIDLTESANQPMSYKGYHIVFNGEIYNYQEIKAELLQLNHKFNTESDTEVILHSWMQWGENAIARWRGMFSLALFDENKLELILIRDRPGVKPLYFYWDGDLFLFGSELKSLMVHPGYTKMINPSSVALFLQYGFVPSPHCIFEHTRKLLPGHILRFKLDARSYNTYSYWNVYDYYNKPKLDISFSEAIEETERILSDSFRYRMVSDVPVGVFLSGGYDSTCVTALLQKDTREKIRTFTIGSTDTKLDEAPFARRIAAHFGTEHTELYCSAKEALDIIPDLPFYYDEPFADSSAIPTILVSRLASQQVTVALSADGGDELFAGYNRYDYLFRYGKKIHKIPAPIRKLIANTLQNIPADTFPFLRNKPNFFSRYKKLRNLLNNPTQAEFVKNLSQVFDDSELNILLARPIIPPQTFYSTHELQPEFNDPLSYMMAVDFQTYLLDDILTKVDRATMSASLEGREPFLDQQIIEWAAQLPSEYKYHNGEKKYLIKEIVHKYVPRSLMERPKMGFGIPIHDWLNNDLKGIVEDVLSPGSIAKHGLFRQNEVFHILSEFYKGRKEYYLKVWHLLMFQIWYERWMKP